MQNGTTPQGAEGLAVSPNEPLSGIAIREPFSERAGEPHEVLPPDSPTDVASAPAAAPDRVTTVGMDVASARSLNHRQADEDL